MILAPKLIKNCSASWAHMRGDARVRHCTHCDRKVYNLSDMTRGEAAKLLAEHEERVCIRFYQRPDGTVMTRDCGLVERARGRFKAIAVGALSLFGFVAYPMMQPSMGVRISPRAMLKHQAQRVRSLTEEIKAEKDPVARKDLIEWRKRESETLKEYARQVMEEERKGS